MDGNKNEEMTIREQIEWLLDHIEDEKLLRTILAMVATVYCGGRW